MAEQDEVLEPYELCYSDLILLSSSDGSSLLSIDEVQRLQTVAGAVIENLGPSGPGLLTITGVPGVSALRNFLLPAARGLALLRSDDCRRILKEHGLGSDVPLKNLDRTVSSFAMQLKYEHSQDPRALGTELAFTSDNDSGVQSHLLDRDSLDRKFENLGHCFKKLGFCMMDLGLHLARVCDKAIGGIELEKSLLEAGTAKGRLIHYHAELDTCLIKEYGKRGGTRSNKRRAGSQKNKHMDEDHLPFVAEKWHNGRNEEVDRSRCSEKKTSELWQQWHYDYGIFTIITSPMFISPRHCHLISKEPLITDHHSMDYCEEECPSPSGHSYLQIFNPNKNAVCLVKTPPESFIVQVGESADILSKGRLRSTLHCVHRPREVEDLSRETFVVFLQPAWTKVFNTTDYHPMEQEQQPGGGSDRTGESCGESEEDAEVGFKKKLNEQIHRIVPPLSSRLRNGMTFAEFSRETTKQYYGGGGLQCNR